MKRFNSQLIAPFILFVTIAVIYLHNLTRDIYSGDVGDLTTAAVLGGVPHPPGYPLFSLLGFLLSHIPLPIPPVTKVALVSVIASFIGLLFIYKLALKLSKNIYIALLSTSILAFSYLFWLHAEVPEVFGLNNFFVIIILYYAICFYLEKKLRYLYLLAFFCGLSLTHHHTILFLFPAVGWILLRHIKVLFSDKKIIPFAILSGVSGMIPYTYVFIAAHNNAQVNWDSVTNLQNFIHLILRKDYGGFAPSVANGIPIIIKQIVVENYFKTLISSYSYQMVFVAIVGLLYLLKKDFWLCVGLVIAFVLTGPLFIFYAATIMTTATAMGIIERFYITSTVIFILFAIYGFVAIYQFLKQKFSNPVFTYVLISYFLIIPALLFFYNYPKTDLSQTQIGNDLAKNHLMPLPKNAVLYLYGDTTTFNIWYAHFVLGIRPDVDLINPAGTGGNKYLDDEINAYYKKNPKIPLNQLVYWTREDIRKRRRVFASHELYNLPPDSILVPKGFVFELMYKKDIPDYETYVKEVKQNSDKVKYKKRQDLTMAEKNLVAPEIPTIYANALLETADFIATHYQKPQDAIPFYQKAIDVDYENSGAFAGLGTSQFKAYKDCKTAEKNIQHAIELYPIWKTYYARLYWLYGQCSNDKRKMETLKKLYKDYFHGDIEKEKLN